MTPGVDPTEAIQRIFALGTLLDMRALAESGNPRAQVLIGFAFSSLWNERRGPRPSGATLDNAQVFEWYRRAAEAGDARGQAALGLIYFQGLVVPYSRPESVRYFSFAAAQGSPDSMYYLGIILYHDTRDPQNRAAGVAWLRRGAAAGSSSAAFVLRDNNIPPQ